MQFLVMINFLSNSIFISNFLTFHDFFSKTPIFSGLFRTFVFLFCFSWFSWQCGNHNHVSQVADIVCSSMKCQVKTNTCLKFNIQKKLWEFLNCGNSAYGEYNQITVQFYFSHGTVLVVKPIKTKQSKENIYTHKTMSKHMMQYFKEIFIFFVV